MTNIDWTFKSLRPTRLASALAIAGVVLLGACASTPPPNEELAVGRAAVERASSSAAAEAPVELAVARDKITRANAAFAAKDYALASQLAQQAEADATLAEAQSRSVRSARALAEVRDGIRMLREEMARKTAPPA
jgi:major membrane immunogen (membrane-anchored lipoprotein)